MEPASWITRYVPIGSILLNGWSNIKRAKLVALYTARAIIVASQAIMVLQEEREREKDRDDHSALWAKKGIK